MREIVQHVLYNSFHPFQEDLIKAIESAFISDALDSFEPNKISPFLLPPDHNQNENEPANKSRNSSFALRRLTGKVLNFSAGVNLLLPPAKSNRPSFGAVDENSTETTKALGPGASPMTSNSAFAPRRASILDVVKDATAAKKLSASPNVNNKSPSSSSSNLHSARGSLAPSSAARNAISHSTPFLDVGVKFEQVYDNLFQGQWPLVVRNQSDEIAANEIKVKLLTEEVERLKQLNEILVNERNDDAVIERQSLAAQQIIKV